MRPDILHNAAGRGSTAIIQYVADRGARLDRKDKQGRTALDIDKFARGDALFRGGSAFLLFYRAAERTRFPAQFWLGQDKEHAHYLRVPQLRDDVPAGGGAGVRDACDYLPAVEAGHRHAQAIEQVPAVGLWDQQGS